MSQLRTKKRTSKPLWINQRPSTVRNLTPRPYRFQKQLLAVLPGRQAGRPSVTLSRAGATAPAGIGSSLGGAFAWQCSAVQCSAQKTGRQVHGVHGTRRTDFCASCVRHSGRAFPSQPGDESIRMLGRSGIPILGPGFRRRETRSEKGDGECWCWVCAARIETVLRCKLSRYRTRRRSQV